MDGSTTMQEAVAAFDKADWDDCYPHAAMLREIVAGLCGLPCLHKDAASRAAHERMSEYVTGAAIQGTGQRPDLRIGAMGELLGPIPRPASDDKGLP